MALPNCPKCGGEYVYEDGPLLICPECAYEWSQAEADAEAEAALVKDSNGNVLQDGDIIESRFAVERRNRTIHSRMREYLYELKPHEQLQTSIIPLGDGVALSIKR